MKQSLWLPGTDPGAHILDALSRAIAASKKEKRYLLTSGELIDELPLRYTYRFTLVKMKALSVKSELLLESPDFKKPLQLEIRALTPPTITFVVSQRLPEQTLKHATLLIDQAWLLKKLKGSLEHQLFASQIEAVLFDLQNPREPIPTHLVDVHLEKILRGVFKPDEYQQRAIERALREELLLIIGPPGTGKTDVLAAIALAHLLRRSTPRILILAHTNIALDNAIERLVMFCRFAGKQALLNERKVIRVGTPRLAALSGDTYKSVVVPLIAKEEMRSVLLEIKQLEQNRANLRTRLAENKQEEELLEPAWGMERDLLDKEIKVLGKQLTKLQRSSQLELASKRSSVNALQRQYEQAESYADNVDKTTQKATNERRQAEQELRQKKATIKIYELQLTRWQRKTPVGRFFAKMTAWLLKTRVDYQQMLADMRTARDQADIALAAVQETERQWIETQEKASGQRDDAKQQYDLTKQELEDAEVSALAQKTQLETERNKLFTDLTTGDGKLAALHTTVADLESKIFARGQELTKLDKSLIDSQRDLSHNLVDHAQVVGVTLTGLFLSSHLLGQHWDVVIVDEASMVQIPAIQLAARCAESHLILIGDPLQLAPVCKFEQETIAFWLKQDIYALGKYTIEDADKGVHSCALLPYQSRMHQEICDLIRKPIYHDLLRDRDPQPSRLQIAPYPESPVVLYDTSGQSWATRPDDGSRQNIFHAELVGRLVKEMLASLPKVAPECIGVVTPYRPQVRLIQEELRRRNIAEWVRVGTVHTFQGLEFVGVIFDTVDAPGINLSSFTNDKWGSDAMRLINVAVTRARDKLVLVANLEYQLQAPERFIMPQVLTIARAKHYVHIIGSSGR